MKQIIMKNIRHYILCPYLIILGFFLVSCLDSHIPDRLAYAMSFSGSNRHELEKVLEYYKDDSLKLKAAIYLIENLPYYYCYKQDDLKDLYNVLEQICDSGRYDKNKYSYLSSFQYSKVPKIYDAHVINSDFLIENIDYSFKVWHERPWGKYISFDDFCEFILPYRIKNEPLTHWKKELYERYMPILDSLYSGSDVISACSLMNNYLNKYRWNYFSEFNLPSLPADFLVEHRVGDCGAMADYSLLIMRSVGIPVVKDFYIYSPVRSNSHCWNSVLDTTGTTVSFFNTDFSPERGRHVNYIKGKVYRHCYALQTESLISLQSESTIPPTLNNFFIHDVSADYFPTDSINVDCDYLSRYSGNFIWMGVFSPDGWVIIDKGIYNSGKAFFKNLEPGLVYATFYYDDNKLLHPAGPAFKIDPETGVTLHFRPVGTTTIELRRKYPDSKSNRMFMERMTHGRFEGACTPDFSDADVLYKIIRKPDGKYHDVKICNDRKYRYVRYISDDIYPGDIAELEFYGNVNDSLPLRGKTISSAPYTKKPEFDAVNAFDGNRLTYFSGATHPGWVGLDLGTAERICRIRYMPRNDDNYVKAGNLYELFYYSQDGWKSLGSKLAKSDTLIYDNAPRNALFWLRNLTEGKEEQVFSYYGNKQHFNLKEVE